jgi:hypothetical protein
MFAPMAGVFLISGKAMKIHFRMDRYLSHKAKASARAVRDEIAAALFNAATIAASLAIAFSLVFQTAPEISPHPRRPAVAPQSFDV